MNTKKLLALALALVLTLISMGVIAYAQSADDAATPAVIPESTATPDGGNETPASENESGEGAAPAAPAAEEPTGELTTNTEPAEESTTNTASAEESATNTEPVEESTTNTEPAEQPAEEIVPKSVLVAMSYNTETLQLGSVITLTATLTGFDGLEYTAVWQRAAADSEGHITGEWQDVKAGTLTHTYTLAEDNLLTAWRLCVTVNQ